MAPTSLWGAVAPAASDKSFDAAGRRIVNLRCAGGAGAVFFCALGSVSWEMFCRTESIIYDALLRRKSLASVWWEELASVQGPSQLSLRAASEPAAVKAQIKRDQCASALPALFVAAP